jgi:hypothetical protein
VSTKTVATSGMCRNALNDAALLEPLASEAADPMSLSL